MEIFDDVVSLRDLCLLTVSSYLSPSNVWSIHRLVPYVHCPRIEHIVHSFICDNFMDISHTDQFLALGEKEIQWLLDNQDIKVSEAAMLDSLARWYKHKERQRETAFKQLFDKLHLSVIGKDVLSEVIKEYQLVKVIPELRKYKRLLPQRVHLDDLIYQENISNMALISMPTKYLKNRTFRYLPFRSGVIKYNMPFISKDFDIELKEIAINKWATYLIHYHEKLYILDTTEPDDPYGNGIRKDVFVSIDLNTRTKHQCSDPPEEVPSNGLSVVCGIYLFIIGGQKCIHSSALESLTLGKTVFRYDLVNDKWARMPSTLFGHSRNNVFAVEFALSYCNRFLYVFGIDCERYDLYTNTWAPIFVHHSFQRGICCSSAHVLNGDIYLLVIPRDQPTVRCFVYSVANNTWQEPFKHVAYCHITKVFFGKTVDISKELLEQGSNNRQNQYKISELKISKGASNRKLKVSNEKAFISNLGSGFVAYDATILSRGKSYKLKQT